jgi:hypothetical protein
VCNNCFFRWKVWFWPNYLHHCSRKLSFENHVNWSTRLVFYWLVCRHRVLRTSSILATVFVDNLPFWAAEAAVYWFLLPSHWSAYRDVVHDVRNMNIHSLSQMFLVTAITIAPKHRTEQITRVCRLLSSSADVKPVAEDLL